MLSSFSSNAILAKSRAMYGRRLTAQNYSDLLSCRTVGDVATYLKARTAYGDIFEGVATATIHRGHLEDMLKKKLLKQHATLSKYEMSIGQDFYRYFIMKNDIAQILNCVKLLYAGHPKDYLFAMPAFFNEHTDLDLFKLAGINSFGDLLVALEGSDYKKVLEPFQATFNDKKSNLYIEAALNKYLYNQLLQMTAGELKGKHLEGILNVLRIQADMRTIINIYRLKRLLNAGEDILRKFTVPAISNFTDKQLTKLVEAPNEQEMLKSLNSTPYGKQLEKIESDYIELAAQKLLYSWNLKTFRFSTDPTVVWLCYIFLAENEIINITHIIEGVRYNVPPEDIRAMLIGAGN